MIGFSPIRVPAEYNYIGVFLSLDCNFSCGYCINRANGSLQSRGHLGAKEWLGYLNRLDLAPDLPLSVQGGEPSRHPEFFEILSGLKEGLNVDLLTNLSFDVRAFAERVPVGKFQRPAPYPAIRATFHPGQADLEDMLVKLRYLIEKGYSAGLYSIRRPGHEKIIAKTDRRAREAGIEHRTKEFLGQWRGKVWGTYQYPQGLYSPQNAGCECRTSELLIAPDGAIHRCHRDLYLGEYAIGHIAKGRYQPEYVFRACDKFGECNPCDVKRKTNRFQIDGHSSVEIRRPQAALH